MYKCYREFRESRGIFELPGVVSPFRMLHAPRCPLLLSTSPPSFSLLLSPGDDDDDSPFEACARRCTCCTRRRTDDSPPRPPVLPPQVIIGVDGTAQQPPSDQFMYGRTSNGGAAAIGGGDAVIQPQSAGPRVAGAMRLRGTGGSAASRAADAAQARLSTMKVSGADRSFLARRCACCLGAPLDARVVNGRGFSGQACM
jgi:hypothetical protein